MSAAWQEYVDCRESEFVAELAGLIDWGSASSYPLRNVPLGTYNVTLPAVVNRNRVMRDRPIPPDEPAVPCWEYDVNWWAVPPTALLQPERFQVWQDYNPEEHSFFVGYTVTTTSGSETNLDVYFNETYTYLDITLLTTVIGGSESISTNWAGSILFTGYLDGIEVGTSTLTVTGTLDVIQYIEAV